MISRRRFVGGAAMGMAMAPAAGLARPGLGWSLPFSPVATDAPAETLRLVPYGCTLLRMSEFPIVKA